MAKEDIPVRIDIPGATARQLTEFGDATGYGKISGEYFSLGAGTDIAPLLQGLDNNLCQSPHWGYVLEGKLSVGFADGHVEVVSASDIFYWPPGHTVKAEEETEMVLFSPQHEHSHVIDHILGKLQESQK
jgi:prepilin-type processing-associated H-X9-DG protein